MIPARSPEVDIESPPELVRVTVIVSLTGVPSCETVTAEDEGAMLKLEVGGVTMAGVEPPPPPHAVMNPARRIIKIRVRRMLESLEAELRLGNH
jgi:hypothetical protein